MSDRVMRSIIAEIDQVRSTAADRYGGRPMADNGMKGRVKGLLSSVAPLEGPLDQPTEGATSDPKTQRQALQVLTLAQRTAEEHVSEAHHQADKIVSDARS